VAALFPPGEVAVRALAAGADAICMGSATEKSILEVRDAIVDAVRAGTLPEERLAEAAARVLTLSRWYGEQQALRDEAVTDVDLGVGLEAAKAALTVTGEAKLSGPPLVIAVNTRFTRAVDPATPTGITSALTELVPGTARIQLSSGDELPPFDERQVVLVVHDAARHPWVRERVAQAVALRPDVIVVDTGIPDTPAGGAHLATHGISRVAARAAAEWLTR
ncbi:MAG: glycoside hydrolase family 3 protein, partial [Nonomuraea sp.]|nr:glycoside hydrolase family 3 protein [Nonomuraea sp.]